MEDQPLLSPMRLLRGVRRWIWWIVDREKDVPFFVFMRYDNRPRARERVGIRW